MIALLRRLAGARMARLTIRARIVLSAVAVLVLMATGLGALRLERLAVAGLHTCSNSGPTVVLHANAECVGVTDGSFKFAAALDDVENKIYQENDRVRKTHERYESVAVLLPISSTDDSVEPISAAIKQLEGAYTAQYYANHNNVQGTAPLIQLLIASSGTEAAGYATTDAILHSDVASQGLDAVTGIWISLKNTISEAGELTREGIPVIGSTITSDDFDNIRNMVRVSPSNAEQVRAAVDYIKPKAHTAMLIQDVNGDDSYSRTLVGGFKALFKDGSHQITNTETYDTTGDIDSSGAVGQQIANRIGQIPSDICTYRPDVVLFAGRGRELALLLSDFANQPCKFRVTILTGDSAADTQLTPSVRSALGNKVKLIYAGEANPANGISPGEGAPTKGYRARSFSRGGRALPSSAWRSQVTSPCHPPPTARR